jgi:hypothetical protein
MSNMFLEILDMSFSLDGVIGAFAITQDIVIILIGLIIGAIVMRQFTLLLVRKSTLEQFLFLEHGAHYAVGALSLLMLYTLFAKIPNIVIGGLGMSIILMSIGSSISHQRKMRKQNLSGKSASVGENSYTSTPYLDTTAYLHEE